MAPGVWLVLRGVAVPALCRGACGGGALSHKPGEWAASQVFPERLVRVTVYAVHPASRSRSTKY